MHNEQDLKNTPEYRSGMFRIVTCPVCGYPTLDMYWICEHCGWEYDIELQTEDEESPCNGMSLRAYRELYKTGGISMNVTICSRKAAEELLRTDTLSRTAVISFCDPPSVGKPAPTPPHQSALPYKHNRRSAPRSSVQLKVSYFEEGGESPLCLPRRRTLRKRSDRLIPLHRIANHAVIRNSTPLISGHFVLHGADSMLGGSL